MEFMELFFHKGKTVIAGNSNQWLNTFFVSQIIETIVILQIWGLCPATREEHFGEEVNHPKGLTTSNFISGGSGANYSPRNQKMYVHSEHTKQCADLFAQSNLKNVATDVLSCACLVQNN
jgi:hypothetical protein